MKTTVTQAVRPTDCRDLDRLLTVIHRPSRFLYRDFHRTVNAAHKLVKEGRVDLETVTDALRTAAEPLPLSWDVVEHCLYCARRDVLGGRS